ncbi:uncharacterized protein BKA78DRAFT_310101 [Phyllosticta capitalensis]|uniref:uncharacterized protein n=1 Tax=Phyllosticta capitalensis TaxID=121624 RepID=UPI00312E326B
MMAPRQTKAAIILLSLLARQVVAAQTTTTTTSPAHTAGGTTTTLLWPQPTHLLPKTNTSNSHPSSNHIALKLFFGLIIPLFLIVVIALLVYFYRRSRASQVQPSDEAGTSADQQLPAYKQRPEEVGPEEPPPAYRP